MYWVSSSPSYFPGIYSQIVQAGKRNPSLLLCLFTIMHILGGNHPGCKIGLPLFSLVRLSLLGGDFLPFSPQMVG